MRKLILGLLAALALAAPASAEEGEPDRAKPADKPRVLRIAGEIVRMTERAVAVENRVGDAVLTCLVPERAASKLERFEVGDAVRMQCLRHRGRRAVLLNLHPLEPEKRPEKPAPERREATGHVAELGEGLIVVQARDGRLACRVPAEKAAKLTGLKVGDAVKILCAGGVLVGLERPAAATPKPESKPEPKPGDDARVHGRIAELSRESVTVRGEAGSLTCRVPAGMAEKLARFAVGDAVKMLCRGGELTYLEKAA
jgi:hypothetical protein